MYWGTLSSQALKDKILATCNNSKVRPQNDTVLVADPNVVNYNIDVTLTLLDDAVSADILSQVNANLSAYQQERINKLGKDIVISQIIGQCMIADKVYKVVVNSPGADVVADPSTYTKCTGISVTIGGATDG